jgi:hypothetical protein
MSQHPRPWSWVSSLGVDDTSSVCGADRFALELYRPVTLTEEQVQRFLGYRIRMQVDGFLKEHGVYFDYTLEDRDTETSHEFSSRRSL